jgi:hypothetical protein
LTREATISMTNGFYANRRSPQAYFRFRSAATFSIIECFFGYFQAIGERSRDRSMPLVSRGACFANACFAPIRVAKSRKSADEFARSREWIASLFPQLVRISAGCSSDRISLICGKLIQARSPMMTRRSGDLTRRRLAAAKLRQLRRAALIASRRLSIRVVLAVCAYRIAIIREGRRGGNRARILRFEIESKCRDCAPSNERQEQFRARDCRG